MKEATDRAGLLRYGIPNMKLDKKVIDRRVDLLTKAGVEFCCNVNVGVDLTAEELTQQYDSVILACSIHPRDISVPGRDAEGIYFAVDFLGKVTKTLLDSDFSKVLYELAKGKQVLVIGGGDTGNDCVGTAIRLKAAGVTQLEMMPRHRLPERKATPAPMAEGLQDGLRSGRSHFCIRQGPESVPDHGNGIHRRTKRDM